jgi:hypothetical protein
MVRRPTASSAIHQRQRHAAARVRFGLSFVLPSCLSVIVMAS